MNLKTVLFLCVLIVGSLSAECGKCLEKNADCSDSSNQCSAGLRCASVEYGSAKVCLPTIEPGEACGEYAYDPCPSFYACDADSLTCDGVGRYASLNDRCGNDNDCKNGLSCTDNICTTDNCQNGGCPIYQTCENQGGGNRVCVDRADVGESCGNTADCWKGTCISNVCREMFSSVEGADCVMTSSCEPGLVCESRGAEPKCYEPNFYFLKNNDVEWGGECDSTVDAGCQCDFNRKREYFLLEVSPALSKNCASAYDSYYDCLRENECQAQVFFEGACMANCYDKFKTFDNACTPNSLNAPTCSASDMFLSVLLIIVFIFLN